MKVILCVLIVLIGCICETASAQQNPDCANCTGGTFPSVLGITLTTAVTHGPCDQSTSHMLNAANFGRMWGIAGNRYNISLCNNSGNTVLYITTNTTIPGVITCNDDGCGIPSGPSSVSFVPSATNTYRIYVFNTTFGTVYPSPTDLEVEISCISTVPPPNDDPCGAQALSIDAECEFIPGNNEAATNSQFVVPALGPPPSCTGALYQGGDVWYSVTVPTNGLIGIQTQENTICAGAFQLYTATACNGTFTQLPGGCITNGLTGPTSEPATVFDAFASGLAPGQTIYIRYWERNGNENGTFGICAFEVNSPINDQPCSPSPLPLTTSCIPVESNYGFSYPSTVPSPGCGGNSINDIWYSVTVPNPLPVDWAGMVVETAASSPVNLAMAWYRLNGSPCTPANLQLLACDPSGIINSQSIPLTLFPGETIYVRIWGETPWQGPFTICAYMNMAPPNDDPCGAIALPLNYGCLMGAYTNMAATQTSTSPPGTIDVPAPSCGGQSNSDVWFTVIVPPNGTVQLDMQASGVTDAAMAAYRVLSGACDTGDLQLEQIACAVNGSQQGTGNSEMPYLNITGETPGSTLYLRIWRQTGSDGPFYLCARRTDQPPGNCFYTLNMQDSAGDGWGGSYVTICIGGNCVNYTVTGSTASISIGANVGQQFTVSYTAVGGNQAQNSFSIMHFTQPMYVSLSPPPQGMVISTTVSCNPPPIPPSDCLGASWICSISTVPCNVYASYDDPDLNDENSGCLEAEIQGRWFLINIGTITPPCSPLAFDIVGGNQVGCASATDNIFDFAVWGPFPPNSYPSIICPIEQQPIRCNYANISTPGIKGLAYDNGLPDHQYANGGAMAKHLIVSPCEVYMIYVDNRDSTGQQFQLQWKIPTSTFQVDVDDCAEPPPPGTMADISCGYGGCMPVSISQEDPMKNSIHPNPVTDILQIDQALPNTSSYQIIDPSGRLVLTGQFNGTRNDIQVGDLDAGTYIIKVESIDGSSVSTHRFIKQ